MVRWIRHSELVCVDCGYDLRGLATTRCPECGTPLGSTVEQQELEVARNTRRLVTIRRATLVGIGVSYAVLPITVLSYLGGLFTLVLAGFVLGISFLLLIVLIPELLWNVGHRRMVCNVKKGVRERFEQARGDTIWTLAIGASMLAILGVYFAYLLSQEAVK